MVRPWRAAEQVNVRLHAGAKEVNGDAERGKTICVGAHTVYSVSLPSASRPATSRPSTRRAPRFVRSCRATQPRKRSPGLRAGPLARDPALRSRTNPSLRGGGSAAPSTALALVRPTSRPDAGLGAHRHAGGPARRLGLLWPRRCVRRAACAPPTPPTTHRSDRVHPHPERPRVWDSRTFRCGVDRSKLRDRKRGHVRSVNRRAARWGRVRLPLADTAATMPPVER
jgi:hypothetical protein